MARKTYPVVVDLHRHADGLHVRSAKVVCDGREIPSQADDLNGDFRADELAFTADIPAQGEAVYPYHAVRYGRSPKLPSRNTRLLETARRERKAPGNEIHHLSR